MKKCSRQHLDNDAKFDTAFAALEGVRAIRTLVLAAIKPVGSIVHLIMNEVIQCMELSAKKKTAEL